MLHAGSAGEIRRLCTDDVDADRRSLRIGQRPTPTPLDPATWAALQRCLDHGEQLATHNPYLLVTKITATRTTRRISTGGRTG